MDLSLAEALEITKKHHGMCFRHKSMDENEYFYIKYIDNKPVIYNDLSKSILNYDIDNGWECCSRYKIGQIIEAREVNELLGYDVKHLDFNPRLTIALTNVDDFDVIHGICYYNGKLGNVSLPTENWAYFHITNEYDSFEDAIASEEWLESKSRKNIQDLEIIKGY